MSIRAAGCLGVVAATLFAACSSAPPDGKPDAAGGAADSSATMSDGPMADLAAADAGPGSIAGTVAGKSLTVRDALFTVLQGRSIFNGTLDGGAPSGGNATGLVLSTAPGQCAVLSKDSLSKTSQFFFLQLAVLKDASTPNTEVLAPATFTIHRDTDKVYPPAAAAIARYYDLDGTCGPISNLAATSGTVTIQLVSNDQLAGTFDLTFENADHVSGDFNASHCAFTGAATGCL